MTEGNGGRRIYWVGGSKGGVGKSMMTLATVDHLLDRGVLSPAVFRDRILAFGRDGRGRVCRNGPSARGA